MEDLIAHIDFASRTIDLRNDQWKRLDENREAEIRCLIESVFVHGKPRVWWLSLRNVIHKIPSDGTTPSQALQRFGIGTDESIIFLPDPDDGTPIPAYACHVPALEAVLGECYLFEYYILTASMTKLFAFTDHDECLVATAGDPITP